jgi:cytoskeletal protein RodZ
VDDELGLLPDQQDPAPPRRPLGLLIGALVLVAVLAVAGVFWMVATVADRSGRTTVAGSASPAPATTAPTAAASATVPPTTTAAPTTAAPTSAGPVRTTAVATTPPPAPKPTPKPTPRPVPTPRPIPVPTLTVPAGKLVRVPDVIGLRVAQASTLVRKAGLKVQVIGGVLDPDRDDRRITAERPSAGAAVPAGSTVLLVTDGT